MEKGFVVLYQKLSKYSEMYASLINPTCTGRERETGCRRTQKSDISVTWIKQVSDKRGFTVFSFVCFCLILYM